jgi:hypothetical protein
MQVSFLGSGLVVAAVVSLVAAEVYFFSLKTLYCSKILSTPLQKVLRCGRLAVSQAKAR